MSLETRLSPADPPASPLGIGLQWASRISAIGIMFVLPALVGAWVDRYLGTSPWLTILGCFLGISAGMFEILRIAREGARSSQR